MQNSGAKRLKENEKKESFVVIKFEELVETYCFT